VGDVCPKITEWTGEVKMATIAELQEKVTNAAAKVEKIKGTIQKHEAAAAKKLAALAKFGITADNMESFKGRGSEHFRAIWEVESKLNDAKGAQRKLRDAEKVLNNWKAKLDIEIEKERFLNDKAPAVIKEFLAKWKEMAYDWHVKRFERFQELKKELKAEAAAAVTEFVKANPEAADAVRIGRPVKALDKYLKERNLDWRGIKVRERAFAGPIVLKMDTYYDEAERLAYLEKELEADRKAKMIDLIHRVNEVVGTIIDASGLRIDPKGNLNGIIVGEKGKAKVETIGAGGYNIQVFHFRTLVHNME
jgi:hypothetical protein